MTREKVPDRQTDRQTDKQSETLWRPVFCSVATLALVLGLVSLLPRCLLLYSSSSLGKGESVKYCFSTAASAKIALILTD